jgi:hypothetical protein
MEGLSESSAAWSWRVPTARRQLIRRSARRGVAAELRQAGRRLAAADLLAADLTDLEHALGPDGFDACRCRRLLVETLERVGRVPEAAALRQANLEALEPAAKAGPAAPWATLLGSPGIHRAAATSDPRGLVDALADAYAAAGCLDEATPLRVAELARAESECGPDHPLTCLARSRWARLYADAGRTEEELALLEDNLQAQTKRFGPRHRPTRPGNRSL